jgi:hypothetical protein
LIIIENNDFITVIRKHLKTVILKKTVILSALPSADFPKELPVRGTVTPRVRAQGEK